MIYLDDIIYNIEKEKCVLFVGSLVGVPKGERPLDRINRDLKSFREIEIDQYYKRDQLFFFTNQSSKHQTYRTINRLYGNLPPEPIHEQIAQIPLDLVVSVSPELRLKKAYDQYCGEINKDYFFMHYNMRRELKEIKPDRNHPLLYNLCGSLEDEHSVIFTFEDLADFFESAFTNKLPVEFIYEIKEANTFVFIGCDFNVWYTKLIFRLLNIHKDSLMVYATDQADLDEETRIFYQKNFKVRFLEGDVDTFVEELYEKCKEKDLLRKEKQPVLVENSEKKGGLKEEILGMIADGQIGEAITKLMVYFDKNEDTESLFEVITQSAKFRDLEKQIREKTIKSEDIEVGKSRIIKALLQITKNIKES